MDAYICIKKPEQCLLLMCILMTLLDGKLTPPAYMKGIEPNWSKIRTFVLDSASQFKPIPPPKFSMEKELRFIPN
jgi:hypothetical protein